MRIGDAADADLLTVNTVGFAAWRETQLGACTTAGMCLASQIYARDDHGTRVVDSAPRQSSNPLTNALQNLSLSDNLLTWTHNGTQQQITLR